MEKLKCQTEEFLAYDPWGQPKILSRSGSFVSKAQEESVPNKIPSSPNSGPQGSPSQGPWGKARFFGSFDAFRSKLTAKPAA